MKIRRLRRADHRLLWSAPAAKQTCPPVFRECPAAQQPGLFRSNGVSRMAILIEKDRMRVFCNPVANHQNDTEGRERHIPRNQAIFISFYFPARGIMNVVSSEYTSPPGCVTARTLKMSDEFGSLTPAGTATPINSSDGLTGIHRNRRMNRQYEPDSDLPDPTGRLLLMGPIADDDPESVELLFSTDAPFVNRTLRSAATRTNTGFRIERATVNPDP